MALATIATGQFNRHGADDALGSVCVARGGEHGARDRMQRELVERARDGDADAFRDLVQEVSRRLYGIAYRILRDPDRAQDALQQALIQLWDGLPGLRRGRRDQRGRGAQAWIASSVMRRAWIRQITRVSRDCCSRG